MKRIVLLVTTFCALLMLQGCADKNIDLVKNSNFTGYQTVTIGKMLDNAFENTTWTSEKNSSGETVVKFQGKIPQKMHDRLKQQLLKAERGNFRSEYDALKYLWQWLPIAMPEFKNELAQPIFNKCDKYDKAKNELDREKAALENVRKGDFSNYDQAKIGDKIFREEIVKNAEKKWKNAEKEWNAAKHMFGPEWKVAEKACFDELQKLTGETFSKFYWIPGNTVIFEWKIHSNGQSFQLFEFGGKNLPRARLDDFLKIIFPQ